MLQKACHKKSTWKIKFDHRKTMLTSINGYMEYKTFKFPFKK
jgi:hypothetical protein